MSRKKQKNRKKLAAFGRRCGFLGLKIKNTQERHDKYREILAGRTWPAYLTATNNWDAWKKYQVELAAKEKAVRKGEKEPIVIPLKAA